MTIDEKRRRVNKFCGDFMDECDKCPLSNDCGLCDFDGFSVLSDNEVERAYNLAFGGEDQVCRKGGEKK